LEHTEAAGYEKEIGIVDPNAVLLILTWITFFLLLAILKKYAWKPILSGLRQREETIQRSLDRADAIEREMAVLEQKTRAILKDAEAEAKALIDESRKAAVEAAKHIQAKAKDEARIILENTRREIHSEVERAQADLRAQSAKTAVELTRRLIKEELSEERSRRVIDDYIKQI
jgi:F-type H+-transporting ATPase subunit b